jgi:CheY-like chemotaxis protein
MPKKVLLIESDAAFARETSDALEAKGFQVRVTGDGKEGLDLAQEQRPDAIVLCVELPKMSGYSVIQKLKKDEGLKTIPVVLTSAEATSDTFEAHKKLKARAEEYLLKPFEPSVLAGKLVALLGLPSSGGGEEEEVVALEEELALDTLGEADEELPSLESPEPIGEADAKPDDDEDLRLLDDAFQTLSGPSASGAKAAPEPLPPLESPVSHDELVAAAASLPDDETSSAPQGLQGLPDEADALLDALAPEARQVDEPPQEDEKLEPLDDIPIPADPVPPPPPAIRPASAQALRAAGIPLLDPDTAPAPAPTRSARERSKAGGWDNIDAPLRSEPASRTSASSSAPVPPLAAAHAPAPTRFEPRNDKAVAELAERKAEIDRLQSKLDALLGSTRKLDADLRASKEEARKAAERAGTAQAESTSLRERLQAAQHEADEKSRESADLSGRVEALENEAERLRTEAEKLRTELVVSRGEAEGARNELERRSLEAEQHIAGLSQQSAEVERQNAELEQQLREADQRLAEASQQHSDLSQQHAELERQHSDLSQQHADLGQQHTELERARADLAQQHADLERRLQEGEEQLGELSQQNTRNEERVVKAYQKIKNDEKLREKIRKALSVAMQLLDETGPADPPDKGARPQPRE